MKAWTVRYAAAACLLALAAVAASTPLRARAQVPSVQGPIQAPRPGRSLLPPLPPLQTAQAGDLTIGYRIYGEDPPLLLILGVGGTEDNWDPSFVARLATQYEVITFDIGA
jgi:hypothetical protein